MPLRTIGYNLRLGFWLALVDDFRTANWDEIIPYPELTYQETQKFLQIPNQQKTSL